MALSDTWLKSSNGRARLKTEEKADRDGLSVRVSPKGKITFQMRYRYAGKPHRLDLGTYPLVGLKDARGECQRYRAILEQGSNPKYVRQDERIKKETALNVEELFRTWYKSYCEPNKASAEEILRSFELHVFKEVGDIPAEDASLHTWMDLMEGLAGEAPAITARILTNAKQMYKWGVRRKLVTQNPIGDIGAKSDLNIKKNAGTRSLDNDEIRYFWKAVECSRMAPKNALFMKLNLFFGCRNGELRLSEKAHFDLEANIWEVPPENHKAGRVTGKPLKRPIIEEVKPLIEQAILLHPDSKYLFPTKRRKGEDDKPMSASAQLSLPYNIRQWLRRHEEYEMAHWSTHDLRKTARTNWSKLTEPHIAEIMLGHKLPGVWQVYDHYDYLNEQAEAYQKWWARLIEVVGTQLSR